MKLMIIIIYCIFFSNYLIAANSKNQIIINCAYNRPSYSDINDEIKKISIGDKLTKGEINLGLQYLRKFNRIKIGVGTDYFLGQKVDTSLKGVDGSIIKTGNIEVSSIDILLPLEYAFNKGKSEIGIGVTPKLSNIKLKQTVNNKTYTQTKTEAGSFIGIYLKQDIGNILFAKLKIGYDLMGKDRAGITGNIGIGANF